MNGKPHVHAVKIKRTIAVAGIILALGACSPGNNFRDLEGVKSVDPDKATVYNNVDQHPNLAVLCIEGVAYITSTRQHQSHTREPDLDKTCPGYTPRR